MRYVVIALLLAAIAAAALPIDDRRTAAEPRERAAATPSPTSTPARPTEHRDVPRARCTAETSGCRAVRGTVIYVERVDPDGDGDLHVVVTGGSVTGPGLTAVDVAADLRPKSDPRAGDRVSAAGPVQTGSYGQSQIHALEFHARSG